MKLLWLCGLAMVKGQQFSFGAAGDYACGQNFLDTLGVAQAANLNLALALGDLGYEASKEAWWCQQWPAHGINELLIVAGNHDIGENCCGDWSTYLNNCPVNSTRNGTNGVRYYYDYPVAAPLARFIMITPGLSGSIGAFNTYGTGGAGLTWVGATIDDARAKHIPWIIVGMHKNYISVLTKSDEIGTPLMDLLFEKRVDLILQGHEHGYERTKHLTCATKNTFNASCVSDAVPSVKGKGTVIVVLGTGGQTLRTICTSDPEWDYFASVESSTYGIGKFVVTADRLAYNFLRSAGSTLQDSFELVASAAPTAATPTTGAPTMPSSAPTSAPTSTPTATTTTAPTVAPSSAPTGAPSNPTNPTAMPTTEAPSIAVLNAAPINNFCFTTPGAAAILTLAFLY